MALTDGLVMTDTGAGDPYTGNGTYYSAGKVDLLWQGSWYDFDTAGVWLSGSVGGIGGGACTFTATGYVPWANKTWSYAGDVYGLASNHSTTFTRYCG